MERLERTVAAMSEKLDDLAREFVPRDEFDRRFDRIDDEIERRFNRHDDKLDRIIETIGARGIQITSLEAKIEEVDELEHRLAAVETIAVDNAARHRKRDSSRSWLWPTIANACSVIVTAVLATVSLLASGHHG